MNKTTIIFLALVIVGYAFVSRPSVAPAFTLQSINDSEDTCVGKERCVMVYVSPWCPACKSSTSLIETVREYCNDSDKVGMRIIIGQDDREKIDEMSNSFGGNMFADESGDYYGQLNGKGVPGWWVLDEKQRVIKSFAGGFAGNNDRVVDHLIDNMLGLGEFI